MKTLKRNNQEMVYAYVSELYATFGTIFLPLLKGRGRGWHVNPSVQDRADFNVKKIESIQCTKFNQMIIQDSKKYVADPTTVHK